MSRRGSSQEPRAKKDEMAETLDPRLASAFQPSSQGHHLESSDWERFVDGSMTGGERVSVVDHLTSCRECALIYKGLLEFAALAPDFDPGAPKETSGAALLVPLPVRKRWLLPTGVALAMAASIVIGVGLMRARPNPAVFRGTSPTPVQLVPQDGALNPDGRISWSKAPGVDSYLITIFAEDGRVLSRLSVEGSNSAAWPQEARAPGIYFWRVSAAKSSTSNTPAASVLSPLGRVEIRP
jgi:hypothetical protein